MGDLIRKCPNIGSGGAVVLSSISTSIWSICGVSDTQRRMDLQVLRQIDLFRNLNAVQLSHLASVAEERALKKNEVLFKEGDKAEHFFVIQKGKVRISKMVPGIGEEALAILDAGSYFGEMELIEPALPRAAQALVHEECVLQQFRYADVHTILNTDSELAVAFLWSVVRTLSERLRATNDKVTAMFALAQFK
jgi:CRP/FNR family transcriptional regulator, cyclic AMP receptor protein